MVPLLIRSKILGYGEVRCLCFARIYFELNNTDEDPPEVDTHTLSLFHLFIDFSPTDGAIDYRLVGMLRSKLVSRRDE